MIPLTIQKPELIPHRQIPVLHYPFRTEELCWGGEHTARKIANTIAHRQRMAYNGQFSLRTPCFPPVPSVFDLSRGTINLGKRNTDEMAYLVRQGQEVIVEEDGGCRNQIILVAIARSQSQEQ